MLDAMRTANSTARIGKHLRGLLRQADFSDIEASASYDSYGTPEKIRKMAESMASTAVAPERIKKWTEAGVTTEAELREISEAAKQLGENPDAFIAQARCEAVGWKA
jgi:hypothetical protein